MSPPAWSSERCGVGFGGETGCRVCVDTCPYEAIRPLGTSGGLQIHIDPGICQRCGACTSACPSSALERAFMQDDEIDARVIEAVALLGKRPVILFMHSASRELTQALSPELPVATVELPSLLILNETHLLHALQCGARGVVILGHPAGHHCAPQLFDTPLRLARVALPPEDAVRLVYVEDMGGPQPHELLERFVRSLQLSDSREVGGLERIEGSHRERFTALAAVHVPRMSTAARLEDVPFGEVTVSESGCTLCGACARVCPTDALEFEVTVGRLSLKSIDCIGCGLCEQACPEDVLSLKPGLRLCAEIFERRTLVEDEVVVCRGCGAPHLPKRLLEHSRKIISAASGKRTASTRQIDLCPSCRSVEADESFLQNERKAGCGIGNCECGGHGGPSASGPEEVAGLSRRSFLGALSVALGGLTALATGKAKGAELAGEGPPPQLTKRLGMVIDLQRCIGCHACTAACKAENDVPLGVYRDWVEEHVLGEYPNAQPYFLPKLCNHCSDPGCLRACPTGAIYMRSDGIVDTNHDICIGCRACIQACPYGVPFVDPVRGTADKCNFCTHRVDEGLNPACVDICPTSCRIFGDLSDPESPPSLALRGKPHQVLRQELGLGPNVRYLGLPAELDR